MKCKYCKTVGWKFAEFPQQFRTHFNITFSHFISISFLALKSSVLEIQQIMRMFCETEELCVREKWWEYWEWDVVSCDRDREKTRARSKERVKSRCRALEVGSETVSYGLCLLLQWLYCLAPLHNVHNMRSFRKFELTGSGSKVGKKWDLNIQHYPGYKKKKRSSGKQTVIRK